MADDAPHHPPLEGSKLVFGMLSLSLVNFMVVLDMTIANVAVPHIAGNLAVSPSQGTWVITSYAVAEAISVPLTGWMSQRFGTVRLAVLCIVLFTAASLLCGLSTTLSMLVAMRVLQGMSGGPLMALAQTLLLGSFKPAKVGSAMAIYSMTTLVAPVLGPILGGTLVDNMSWHWIFFINIPVGALGAFLVWLLYHKRENPTHKVPVDGIGLALLVLSVGSFQIILDKGQELDWFGSNIITALAVISIIGFIVFVTWELTEQNPIVDLRLFRIRNVVTGVAGLATFFGILFGAIVLLPLWLQTQMGYTALQAGLATAPMGLSAVVSAALVGRSMGKIDPRIVVTIGVLIIFVGFMMRVRFTTDVSFFVIALPQVVQGFGMPAIFLPFVVMATTSVAPNRVASTAGLQNFLRTIAGAFGASVTSTVWSDSISQHHADLVPSIASGVGATDYWNQTLSGAGLGPDQIKALLENSVQGQAVMLATNQYFLVTGALLIVVIVIAWLSDPVKISGGMPPPAH